MRAYTLALFSFLMITLARGQSGPYMFSGAGYLGNGQIGLLTKDAESVMTLPALMASRDQWGWTIGAASRSGIDLTEISGAVHVPLPWNDQVGFAIQYTGIEGYAEQRLSLAYARKLFEKLNLALSFELNRNEAEEYDDVYGATWSISLHAPLMTGLSMSAWLYNPLGTESSLDLPSMARIGILYEPGEKIGVALEAEKDWRHELRFKAGMHYQLHPKLALRWGIGTQPSLVHAGITWNIFGNMGLSGGWRYHSQLGSSLGASLSSLEMP